MGFNGEWSPFYAVVFLLAAGLGLVQVRRYFRLYRRKKFLACAFLRILSLVCLLLSLAGLEVTLTSRDTATLFLVDRSLSAESSKERVAEFINEQIAQKQKFRDLAGVVTFGAEPLVEVPLSPNPGTVLLNSLPGAGATNVARALDFCRDYFPAGANKRLVVCTDGEENAGRGWEAVKKLAGDNINLVFFPLSRVLPGDVQITSLALPPGARRGEEVPLNLVLDATFSGEGVFYLFDGEKQIREEKIQVDPGTNRYTFSVATEAGQALRGEIRFSGDENPANNVFTLFPRTPDLPVVLVVGRTGDTGNLNALLDSLGLDRENYTPDQVPDSLGFLSRFGLVVLVNVPCPELPEKFVPVLQTCVREKGTGLLVIGGEETFALGGYESTPLEEMLPVTCKMKGNEKQPNTGLVLVMDCSGSMEDESAGAKKIDMAKKAAAASLDILEDQDYLGVLAFSDLVEWVVPFQPVRNREKIREEMGHLAAKGGTLILPALEEAQKVLEEGDAKVKHIILLTDGQGEKKGYDRLLDQLAASGITLSTVALGRDAERELLAALVQTTGGRNYFAEEIQQVPAIFARETYLSTKKYLNNRTFRPLVQEGGDIFSPETLPLLTGYLGTGLKDRADLLLKSDTGDPVLARWRYGLGQAAVWTPDLTGKWSRDWISWGEFPAVWGKIIRSCFPSFSGEDLDLELNRTGSQVQMVVTLPDEGEGMVEGDLVAPGGSREKISLAPTAPGTFTGTFSLEAEGDYLVEVSRQIQGNQVGRVFQALRLDYSPEYLIPGAGRECYFALSSGEVIDENKNVFQLPLARKNSSRHDPDFILLPLALLAFAGELWARKFL